jgi:hypothetical protein
MQQAQQPSQGQVSAAPQGLPAFNLPDNQDSSKRYQEDAAGSGDRVKIPFVKFPGPAGQTKWEDASVPVGFSMTLKLYLLPPWAPNKPVYAISRSHFYRSNEFPKGMSVTCPGDTCDVCRGRAAGLESPDPVIKDRAKDMGKTKRSFYYNVAMLDNLQGHYVQMPTQPGQQPQWVMRPFVLDAGQKLHRAIGALFDKQHRGGVVGFVDPMRGRPIYVTKTKTGRDRMNVEYSVTDGMPDIILPQFLPLQADPLPQQFWPLLQNLWDLEKVDEPASPSFLAKAARDIYSPVNSGQRQATPPPWANPYQGQQQGQPPMQQQPGAMQYPPQQYPPQQQGQPPQQQPWAPPAQQQMPPPMPPAVPGWVPQGSAQQQMPMGPPMQYPPQQPPQAAPPPAQYPPQQQQWAPPAQVAPPPVVQGSPVPAQWAPPVAPGQPPMGQPPAWVPPPVSTPQTPPPVTSGPPPAVGYPATAMPTGQQPLPGPPPPAGPLPQAAPPAPPGETMEQLQARLAAGAAAGQVQQ